MKDDDYFDDEEFRELLDEYEQAVNAGAPVFMDADDLADIADYYQLKGRYTEADAALERALELQPDSVVALNYQVHNAISRGDYEAAEDYLARITDTETPEYVYDRAEIWLAQGDDERADSYLNDCAKDVPEEEYQDYILDVVNLYTDYGYSDKAMEWMKRARRDNTDDYKELMGRTLLGMGRYDDSERIFNELLDRDPFQKRYWNALASSQFMREDYNAAIASSEYAIAIDPDDAEGLLAKANALYHIENYEEALHYYRRYEERDPDDEYGLLHQGSCLINLGRYDEAIESLLKAEKKAPAGSPYLVEIYEELAFTYNEQGKPETALHYVDQTENLDCDHADMSVVKGHILLSCGRAKEAEQIFRNAIANSEDPTRTTLRVIVSIYDNQYYDVCYKLFRRFFRMAGDDYPDGHAYMALCSNELGRRDDFMHHLKRACELNSHEARLVVGHLFPEGLEPADYYDYMKKNI